MERYQDLALEVKRIHRTTKKTVIAIVIDALGTISKNARPGIWRISLPGIFLHSCQPSLALLILQKAVVSLSFGKLLRHMVFSSYSNHHKISLLTV